VLRIEQFRSLLALAVAGLLLQACAAPQTKQLIAAPPRGLPQKVILDGVPFLAQQAYYCGPAALAMTMNFYGRAVSQGAMARALYVPALKGSLQAEMLAATRQQEMLAYVLRPDLQSLLSEVAAGHPVVVLQNLSVGWYPVWHYAVVIGYDLETRELILHSGRNPYYRVPMSTFERTWARSGYWALVPLPPGKLPADDAPARVLEAAAALEETGHVLAAHRTYTAAARRWPDNLVARMGIGNTCFAMGRIEDAMRAFLSAVRSHSGSAAAYNNLAFTLHELGCGSAAYQAARHAVALDDSQPEYARTLAQINEPSQVRNARECPQIPAPVATDRIGRRAPIWDRCSRCVHRPDSGQGTTTNPSALVGS
jgi:tetratricopeptide (TPR) repeat protein